MTSVRAGDLNVYINMANLGPKISELISSIKDHIMFANKEGSQSLVYELPDMFTAVPDNMQKDATLFIYANVLQRLTDDGFDVRICLKKGSNHLIIKWTNTVSNEEKKKLVDIISKYSIQ